MKNVIPTRRCARRSARSTCSAEASGAALNKRHSTTSAEETSIRLSMPKATRAELPATAPEPMAITASAMFQSVVSHSSWNALR